MKIHRIAFTAAALLAGFCATSANAEVAYMIVQKSVDKPIKGSVTIKGRQNSILVTAYEQTNSVGPAHGDGRSTKTPNQYGLVKITKPVDASSTGLLQALVSNESLHTVSLHFFRASGPQGTEVNYYTVVLKGARVASIRHVMPKGPGPFNATGAIDGAGKGETAFEEIAFDYDELSWSWGVSRTEVKRP